jgi:N-acetylglucosamine-6-phosphate deacetylase
MEKIRLHGGNLIIDNEIRKADLLIRDGKIEATIDTETATADYKVYDCTGMNISAGFVDIHQHGGGGVHIKGNVVRHSGRYGHCGQQNQ